MSVNLEEIKQRIQASVERQAQTFFAGVDEHFVWLDEIVPSVQAMLAAACVAPNACITGCQ